MTTLQMEIELMKHFKFTQNIIVNGVTEASQLVRFEADLLILSKSGYATCVEIKVSKADLKNDNKKKHINSTHENFENYFGVLKYFYYAVPIELKEDALNKIPVFAGLIVVEEVNNEYWNGYRVTELRKPKHLFSYKWDEDERNALLRLGCLRIFNLKKLINKQIKKQ